MVWFSRCCWCFWSGVGEQCGRDRGLSGGSRRAGLREARWDSCRCRRYGRVRQKLFLSWPTASRRWKSEDKRGFFGRKETGHSLPTGRIELGVGKKSSNREPGSWKSWGRGEEGSDQIREKRRLRRHDSLAGDVWRKDVRKEELKKAGKEKEGKKENYWRSWKAQRKRGLCRPWYSFGKRRLGRRRGQGSKSTPPNLGRLGQGEKTTTKEEAGIEPYIQDK